MSWFSTRSAGAAGRLTDHWPERVAGLQTGTGRCQPLARACGKAGIREEELVAGGEKLIRDKVPDIIRAQGGEPVLRIADAGEYRELLRAKLVEEAREVATADEYLDWHRQKIFSA